MTHVTKARSLLDLEGINRPRWRLQTRTNGITGKLCCGLKDFVSARSKVKLESNAAQEANTEPSAERSHYDVATLPHHD